MASSETMRAVDIKDGVGPVSSLFINSSVPKPKPTAEQCLIKVKAFGLNRADTLQREGRYPLPPGVTKILGLEFSGVIEEVGKSTSPSADDAKHNWKVGDKVFGLAYGGTYAEYVAINKGMLLRMPAAMSFETAAGIPETWFTALQALHMVGAYSPATHKAILWHAGASSVSIAGIQLSKLANQHFPGDGADGADDGKPPKVYATARKDDKVEFCEKVLGADRAFNTERPGADWPREVREANGGEGVDLVIDFVGAPYFQGNLDVLARDGRVVQLGTMGGTALPGGVDVGAFVFKRARFEGSTLRSRGVAYQTRLRDLFEEKVLPGLVGGALSAHTDTVLDWEQIQEAHGKMERNETKGKIVCTIS